MTDLRETGEAEEMLLLPATSSSMTGLSVWDDLDRLRPTS